MHKKIIKGFYKHYKNKYEGIYKNAKKLFVFDLILLFGSLCILALSIFLFFWKPTIVDLIDVNFSLRAERIMAGDEIAINIDFKNRSKHNLQDVVLAVHLPEGFLVDRQKTPTDIFGLNSTANIGVIEPGATGGIIIYGRYFAQPLIDEKITAYLSYRPENKKNKEQKISGAFIKAVGSNLLLYFDLPDSSLPGYEMPFVILLENKGKLVIENIEIILNDYELVFNNPESAKNITLLPQEKIELTGFVRAPSKTGDHSINIYAKTDINNNLITIAEQKKEVKIIYPQIKSGIQILTDKDFADGGDTLPLRVYWNNPGTREVADVKLRFVFTPGVVDLNATARANKLTVVGGELVADSRTRTSFYDGSPGSSDEFEIDLKLLPFFKTDGQKILQIKVIAEAVLPENKAQKIVSESAETISINLATQASWQIKSVYYTDEGDQLGRGPLPPVVGGETKYWIFIEIKNGINPIENNNFVAQLGDGIEFSGKESVTIGSNFNYNKETNVISWNHPIIPANSSLGLYFEVQTTPTASQVGSNIILLKSAQYSAKDSDVGKLINLNYGQINNVLQKSEKGSQYKSQVQF